VKNQKLVKLNATEQKNVDLLAAYEAKLREKLATELVKDDTLGAMFAEDLRVLRNEGLRTPRPHLQGWKAAEILRDTGLVQSQTRISKTTS
jgi:hypothetical protein